MTGTGWRGIAALPGLAHQFQTFRRRLEALFGDAQDSEFAVEEGKLWLLQTRTAKRTPWAALHIARDLVDEQLIDPATAVHRRRGYDLGGWCFSSNFTQSNNDQYG